MTVGKKETGVKIGEEEKKDDEGCRANDLRKKGLRGRVSVEDIVFSAFLVIDHELQS